MSDDSTLENQRLVARSIGAGRGRRHIFLCADQTKPKCSEKERSVEAWNFLLQRDPRTGWSVLEARLDSTNDGPW